MYDKIYYAYLNVQFNSTNHYCHRIFLNRDLSRFIALKEEEAQLSKGTTGLCCWQVIFFFSLLKLNKFLN